jgi:hypothetical protein
MPLNWNKLVYYQKQFSMRYGVLTMVLSCMWDSAVSTHVIHCHRPLFMCVCVRAHAFGIAPHILNFGIRWN